PNGDKVLSMYEENDIDTWRDVISWLAQTLACFATIGRDGKLYLKAYGTTPVDVIDDAHRFAGGSFSDFSTYYTGLSIVNLITGTTSYYGLPEDDGLTMNLGTNPFLQYGIAEELDIMRRDILNAIAVINYVPFSINMIGDPAYDLGDILLFTDGIAGDEALTCINKFVFNYHRNYEVKGVGKDPALATAKSKTDKNIEGLINTIEDDSMHFTIFRNATKVQIADGDTKSIMKVKFVTIKTAHVQIYLEIHLEVATTQSETSEGYTVDDAVGTVTYYLNGKEVEDFVPVETWFDGKHILNLHYDLESVEAQLNEFDVWLNMEGGSAVIEKLGIMEVVGGTGMAAAGDWDGTINAEDEFSHLRFSGMFSGFTDQAIVQLINPEVVNVNENLRGLSFGSMFVGLQDNASGV
ncbi:MAG: hypothetical protein HUJ56_07515, partial [Erysipelotrichaceae bacterium]|nr:hypothetical protein [Erysipelotrichaceae bacterium]